MKIPRWFMMDDQSVEGYLERDKRKLERHGVRFYPVTPYYRYAYDGVEVGGFSTLKEAVKDAIERLVEPAPPDQLFLASKIEALEKEVLRLGSLIDGVVR